MLVTRQEIVDEVLTRLGTTSDNVDSTDLTSIRLRVNQIQDYIFFDRAWEWRKRTYRLTLRTPYTTGTIAVTQNSKTVTGTGTSWDDTTRIGYLVLGGIAYKIQAVASTTSLTLETPFPNATATSQSYSIVFPDYYLPHEIESIVSVKLEDIFLNVVNRDQLVLNLDTYSQPEQVAFGDRAKEDYYNTGTVTVTNGSTTVTGSGTTFESLMEGMSFRVNDFSKSYVVKTVDSTTQLTLRDNYEGTGASGKSYTVGAVGTPMITFRNAPDDYYYVEIEALINPDKLVSNTAYSLIPNHAPLLHGAIWLALTDLKGDNPVRIQQARADFDRTLDQLRNAYGVVSNKTWRSNNTGHNRTTGTSSYNPLSD